MTDLVISVAAMAKSDAISWGLFGLVSGALVGFASNGGIPSFIESGVVTGSHGRSSVSRPALRSPSCRRSTRQKLSLRFNTAGPGAVLEV